MLKPTFIHVTDFLYKLNSNHVKIISTSTIKLFALIIISSTTSYAQTCKQSILKTTPNNRFEILGNGNEVKDKKTGLIWQRCSIGQTWDGNACIGTSSGLKWKQALVKATALGNGYRLPNIKELITIVERRCREPAINLNIFPSTQPVSYWSSTPNISRPNDAKAVRFSYGDTAAGTKDGKYSLYFVRAVRSE